MATGDFDYLRAAAAETLSVPAYSNLPTVVAAEVDALINEAYRECFIRPDGKKARWAEQNLTYQFKAPATFTFTATQGAVTMGSVTGLTLEAIFAGSVISTTGGNFRYAGKTAANADVLAEPWTGASGSVSATFYYNSYVLPVETMDICDAPFIMGYTRLLPISSNEQFIKARSSWSDLGQDLWKSDYGWNCTWNWANWSTWFAEYCYGMPQWYWVDDSNLAVDGSFGLVRPRFCIYPLPDRGPLNVSLRGNIVPALMTTGSDVPRIKSAAIIDILLPMVRSKVANSRRYNGDNRDILAQQSQGASLKLDALDSTQRRKPAVAGCKLGW